MNYRYPCEACGRVHILPLDAGTDDNRHKNRLHRCECGSHASLPTRIAPGVIIDAYEILDRLGKGGMGTVWRARQNHESSGQEWSREVALKIWEPAKDGTNDQFTRSLFVSEAQTLAEIQHPNVVTIHDFGTDGDVLYLVMKLIKGKTLEQFLQTIVFSEAQALHFAHTIAVALEDCWQQHRLLHRDLKPGNLILDRSNHLHILDLGLARVGESRRLDSIQGLAIGTPNYMSPEQSRGENVDPRSDIYSLGCTLFHLLTGNRPFAGMSRTEILRAQRAHPVPGPHNERPNVSDECHRILKRMTQKNPEDRYPNWGELAKELKVLVRRHSASAVLVEEPESEVHPQSSLSTIHKGHRFPFVNADLSEPDAATIPPSPTQPKRTRWQTLTGLVLPIAVLGVIIGSLLLWPRIQADEVFDRISELRSDMERLNSKLPKAGQLPGAQLPRIKKKLESTHRCLVTGGTKKAKEELTPIELEFNLFKEQFRDADGNRRAYLIAAQSAPNQTGDVSPEVTTLYDTFRATAQSGSNQYYEAANFAKAATAYEKASHIAYQVTPTMKLEAVKVPRDKAWDAEANTWAPREWKEADDNYQQAASAIPEINSPDVDDLLGKLNAAAEQFESAQITALEISQRFSEISELAEELEINEPFTKNNLNGSASQRLNTLKNERNALENLHGDQTIAAIEALLEDNAYCAAKRASTETGTLELRVADQAKVANRLEQWLGKHLDRGTPKELNLTGFAQASEAWKEGMSIVGANKDCFLVAPLADELKKLADALAMPGGGLNTLDDWKFFHASLEGLDDEYFLRIRETTRWQIAAIEEANRINAEWRAIAEGIHASLDAADILQAAKKLEAADAFLQENSAMEMDHSKWVKDQRAAFCKWLGEIMSPVEATSLKELEANLDSLEAIGPLRELAAMPAVICPSQNVWDYASQFDALTNFVQNLKNPPGWDLHDLPPVQAWTPYFESVENLGRFKRLVDPAALQKALATISETSILPSIREKTHTLPSDQDALARLDYELQRAASEATAKPLRDAFEILRDEVAKRLEGASSPASTDRLPARPITEAP